MKKLYSITLIGRNHVWCFDIDAEPHCVDEWREDGLDIDEVINRIPKWYVDAGFPVVVWCFFQDIFNLKFLDKR